MENIDVVARRRQEVLATVAKARDGIEAAKKVIADGEAELLDLDVTGRTLARLTGAEWPPSGAVKPAKETPNVGPVTKKVVSVVTPTMTEMILEIMGMAAQLKFGPVTPKRMAQEIESHFQTPVKGEYVSSIAWRMWKRGQLRKAGDGLYVLPDENEATDLLSSEDQSAASDINPAQGGEARPGGGT